MAKHGASEVLAFEPDQGNSTILLDQVNENPRLSGRVHLLPFAVSDSCGQLRFIANGASESHIACDKEFGGEIVRCVTLDSIVEQRTPPSFVKVDVEGAEVLVLKGSAKLASEHRPTFMIELHSRKNDSECRGILAAAGYEVRCLSRRDQSNGHVLAVHRSKK
jgi:FkbM family methyltransferase